MKRQFNGGVTLGDLRQATIGDRLPRAVALLMEAGWESIELVSPIPAAHGSGETRLHAGAMMTDEEAVEARPVLERAMRDAYAILDGQREEDSPMQKALRALERHGIHDDEEDLGSDRTCRSVSDGPDTCDCGLEEAMYELQAALGRR